MSRWGGERPGPGWGHSLKQENFHLRLRKTETYLEERLWLHSGSWGTSWCWTFTEGETTTSSHVNSLYFLLLIAHLKSSQEPRKLKLYVLLDNLPCSVVSKHARVLKRKQSWGFNAHTIILFYKERICVSESWNVLSKSTQQHSELRQSLFINTRSFSHCSCSVPKSCLTLLWPMDCSPPASTAHGISQARILE